MEERQKEERTHETGTNIEALIQKQEQMQEHTTAELGLFWGELTNQITRISDVEEFMSNKISKVT